MEPLGLILGYFSDVFFRVLVSQLGWLKKKDKHGFKKIGFYLLSSNKAKNEIQSDEPFFMQIYLQLKIER